MQSRWSVILSQEGLRAFASNHAIRSRFVRGWRSVQASCCSFQVVQRCDSALLHTSFAGNVRPIVRPIVCAVLSCVQLVCAGGKPYHSMRC